MNNGKLLAAGLPGLVLALISPAALPATELEQSIERDVPRLYDLFLHLHAHPELSMQEHRTAERLATELEAEGYRVTRGIGGTGLVAELHNGDGPMLLVRADMDALPVEEKTGLAYASTVRQMNADGLEVPVMHACAHDLHMTSLVGVARQMVAAREHWRGRLVLLGQPAEEMLGGAKAMVRDGLYARIGRPDFALALHGIPKYPAGKVVVNEGLVYSSADTVRIVVRGIATHGASPHLGRDPVVIGSQIVLALQPIVTREISPLEPALVTVGSFRAGAAPNVITDQAVLDITVRANTESTRVQLLAAIERVAVNTARAAGMPETHLPEVIVRPTGSPTTTNDATLARRVRNAIAAGMGSDALLPWFQSDMGAEDFPDLVALDPPIPYVYFEVGVTPPERLADGSWAETHSTLFRIEPEPSIRTAVHAMTLAALELLAPD